MVDPAETAQQIVVHPPRAYARVILACCLVLVGVGVYLLVIGEDPLVAWGIVTLFSCTSVFFGRRALSWHPRLVIDESGVLDRTLGIGLVPWSDIQGAALEFVDDREFVCLQVRHPKESTESTAKVPSGRKKLATANEKADFAEVTLDLSGVSMATEDVLALIQQRCSQARAA
jgi:hypothetical protein